ncbi:MAG: hypothetical protein COZ70_13040 [Deltaproteobacteria bacterium CG_4_8_14_3_um_filter_51_11]|nr:helix-turn-helix domain-containing protein [bacterium]OIP37906.1 MAG: hypothetical protein AUK25_13890 [Desulfobacteraceae bacterium CG2_30_51_40]PIP47997.1 MAG: hypothetical protein COX16_02280 [Deltaproteobacteria bacterium CG23_combo_of_CG06-09_8_20_14_all_51_20]PIX18638.1 MAG: hypothetical protein COZ70_13040 [Deltaproteobacteria bacterium CG_4_8_14_3_um_filter_51_11]PIY25220.1 MAG: hypothetical protein COZ11_05950 [Deltaproteobacteria bacterium CG_4_10_14_3_um_filter_51_14]PJB35712.1 M
MEGTNEETLKEYWAQDVTSLGSMLVSERQKRGLSLEDISEKTRIRFEILKAIETEAWVGLPEPAYIRGFLVSYARALGMNPDAVLDLYNRGTHIARPLKPLRKKARSGKTFYLVILPLIIVFCAGVYIFGKDLLERSKVIARDLFSWDITTERPTAMPNQEAVSTVPEKAEHPDEEAAAHNIRIPETADEEAPDADRQQDEALIQELKPPPEKEPPERKAEEGDIVLKATALKRTWLRVVADGGEPMEYMLTAGMEREFYAKEGFELLIGNAGGIVLEFNGEKMQNLGSPGEVLRLSLPWDIKARGETR